MAPVLGEDISYAVAARDIPEGQMIFTEKPLLIFPVADPSNDFTHVMDLPCIKKKISGIESNDHFASCMAIKPACFGCYRSKEFKKVIKEDQEEEDEGFDCECSKCLLPLCSYKCQMELGHEMGECRGLGSGKVNWKKENKYCVHSLYMDMEILRALQLETYEYSLWDKFLQMKINLRVETYQKSKRYQRFIKNYRELVPISAKTTGYNEDLIGNVHAIITALSFRPSLGSTYKLLFASQILFPHSCIPNTFHYLEGYSSGAPSNFKLVVKASTPICKKEMLCIDFCPTPFVCYPLRRMLLRNMLAIDPCTCKRCKDPRSVNGHTFDVKCRRCRSGLIYAEEAEKWEDSVWACNTCFEEVPFSSILKSYVECREELEAIRTLPKTQIISALVDFITKRGQQDLNEGHSIILQAWGFLDAQLSPTLRATRLPGPAPRYPEEVIEEYKMLSRCTQVLERHMTSVRQGICFERGCILLNRYHAEMAISARRSLRVTTRKEYIKELLMCVKTLNDALKIFQMHEGYTSDVSLHIQDTTSAIVQSRAYIQEQLLTDNEESKSKKVVSSTSTFKETV